MANALRLGGGFVFGVMATPEQVRRRSRAVLEGIQAGWLDLGEPAS